MSCLSAAGDVPDSILLFFGVRVTACLYKVDAGSAGSIRRFRCPSVGKPWPVTVSFWRAFMFLSLQNPVRKNFCFCSFPGRLTARKALPTHGLRGVAVTFLSDCNPGRPLRLFWNGEICCFLTSGFVLKSLCSLAVRPFRGCYKAVVRVRRRPRCNAAAALLQPREGLTAGLPHSRRLAAGMPAPVSGCI